MSEDQKILLKHITDLLESGQEHALQQLLAEQRTSDIADIVELLEPEESRRVFACMETAEAAEVFGKVDEATRGELFEVLEDAEVVNLISELDADDAADVLAELDNEESQEVLDNLDHEDAKQIKELMNYSEDSAGGIMDPVVLSVHEDALVTAAIERIREAEVEEDFYSVFVVDKNGRFLGDVRIRLLITCHADKHIRDLIDCDTIYVNEDTDQEEVVKLFKKNDLIVVPVLDKEHRLIGRITAARILEVAGEEAAEDLYAMAGTDAAELETFSIVNAARVRMTWLLPCFIGTAVTVTFGFLFKSWFDNVGNLDTFLVAFLFAPMIAAISGNAGLQTSAIVIIGLATGDLAALKLSQVFMREARIALLVALCCGMTGSLICSIIPHFFHRQTEKSVSAVQSDTIRTQFEDDLPPVLKRNEYIKIAIAFGIGMFSAIMISTSLGLFLPFLFRHIGLEPAISSGPLVTTANDSISVAIYLFLTFILTR